MNLNNPSSNSAASTLQCWAESSIGSRQGKSQSKDNIMYLGETVAEAEGWLPLKSFHV